MSNESYHYQFEQLNRHSLVVGALQPVGKKSVQFLSMLVNVHNYGKTIRPVNTKYLTIPTPNAQGKSAREIDGLFFHMSKNGKPTLAKVVNNQLQVFFLLAQQVVIPARDFLGSTMDKITPNIQIMFNNGVVDILSGMLDWHELYDKIGHYIVTEVQKTMELKMSPPNAKITQANKGFNNPLIDTGDLVRSMTWKVIESG